MLRVPQHDTRFNRVMLRNEASSSPCMSVMLIEEDVSLSLNMTGSLVNEV
jgi:hypothetical protein